MGTYTREEIEQYMPGVWDTLRVLNAPNPYAPDPDMPKSQTDPRSTVNPVIGCVDMQRAWAAAGLTIREKQVLLLRYGFDELVEDIADLLGLSHQRVSILMDNGLKRIENYLNGKEN